MRNADKSKAGKQAADREVQRLKEENERLRGVDKANNRLRNRIGAGLITTDSLQERLRSAEETLRELGERAAPKDWHTPGHPMNAYMKRELVLHVVNNYFSRYEEPTT